MTDKEIHCAEPEQLLKQYRPLIYKLANRYIHLLAQHPAVDLDDLYQAGAMALIKAQKVYTPEQGSSFIAFAYNPIKWHMLRTLGIMNGQLPPVLESLDAPLFPDDPEAGTLADAIEDTAAADAFETVEKKADAGIVHKAVARLDNEKQRTVIEKVYFEGKQRRTVADELHMKYSGVLSAENAALHRLRRNWQLRELAGVRSHHISLCRFNSGMCSEQEAAVLKAESRIDEQYGEGSYMAMRDLLIL